MAKKRETPEERERRIQGRIDTEKLLRSLNDPKRSRVNKKTGEVEEMLSYDPDPFAKPKSRRDKNDLKALRSLNDRNRTRNPNRAKTKGKKVIDRETGEITYEVDYWHGHSRRSVNANDVYDVDDDFDQPDTTGDLISLSVEVDFNEASWKKTYAKIELYEQAIHALTFETNLNFAMAGRGDTWDRWRAKHFFGVKRRMNDMGARAKFIAPPLWPVWRAYVASMNEANFDSSGLPVGGWAPHDATYGAFRGPATTLVRTGKLKFSLTGGLLTESVSNDSVSFGTRVEYAKFHQYGTTEMPARKIVYEPVGAAKFFGGMVAEWVAWNSIDGMDIV